MNRRIPFFLVCALIVFSAPRYTNAVTTNLLDWEEKQLQIEGETGCTFDVVEKFNGSYYAFSGEQEDINKDGKPFVALTSEDGQNWRPVSESFGVHGDTAVMSSIVWENANGKTHLYVAAKNKETGVNVYRTSDGKKWKRVIVDGLDSKNNDDIRSMVGFKGKLYLFTENDVDSDGARMFVSSTGAKDEWEAKIFTDNLQAPGVLNAKRLKHVLNDGTTDEFIYAVMGDTTFIRTRDGETWEILPFNMMKKGYGVHLEQFDGKIYMATYDEFNNKPRLFRTVDPKINDWEELDFGVQGEETITLFARKKKHDKAKYLYFSTYPSGYIYRIGKDNAQVEISSQAKLGFTYGPTFVVNIIMGNGKFFVYDNTSNFWLKQ